MPTDDEIRKKYEAMDAYAPKALFSVWKALARREGKPPPDPAKLPKEIGRKRFGIGYHKGTLEYSKEFSRAVDQWVRGEITTHEIKAATDDFHSEAEKGFPSIFATVANNTPSQPYSREAAIEEQVRYHGTLPMMSFAASFSREIAELSDDTLSHESRAYVVEEVEILDPRPFGC